MKTMKLICTVSSSKSLLCKHSCNRSLRKSMNCVRPINGEVHLPTSDLKPRVPVSTGKSLDGFKNYSEAAMWKQDEGEALDEETRLCDALTRDESCIIQEEEEDVFSTLAARFEDA